MTGQPPPLPERPHAESKPSRRRAWVWLIAAIVVVGLIVAAWFIGERIARDLVVKTIRDQVVAALDLPDDQGVAVNVTGAVLPQLIAGRLDDVTIASTDVPLADTLTGDLTVHAVGLAFRGEPTAQSLTANVILDQTQLRTLMSSVDGFPAETLGLRDPDLTMTVDLSVLIATFPLGVALTPSATGGELVLSPASLRLGDLEITARDLRSRFGGVADVALRDWNVCLAQYLPAAVALETVAVRGETLVVDTTVDPGVIADPTLRANGTCP